MPDTDARQHPRRRPETGCAAAARDRTDGRGGLDPRRTRPRPTAARARLQAWRAGADWAAADDTDGQDEAALKLPVSA